MTRPGRRPQDLERREERPRSSYPSIPPLEQPPTEDPEAKPRHPKKWRDNNQMILYQVLAGKTTVDIARDMGLTPARVSAIRNSPLFQARIEQEREALRGATITDLLARITAEAVPNFDFLVRMRDNPMDHQDDPRVRLAAARQIEEAVDRVIPKKKQVEETRHTTFSVDQESLKRMHEALMQVSQGPPIEVPYRPAESEEPWSLEAAEQALREEEEAGADESDSAAG